MNELSANVSSAKFVDGLSGRRLYCVNSDFIGFSEVCKDRAIRGRKGH